MDQESPKDINMMEVIQRHREEIKRREEQDRRELDWNDPNIVIASIFGDLST